MSVAASTVTEPGRIIVGRTTLVQLVACRLHFVRASTEARTPRGTTTERRRRHQQYPHRQPQRQHRPFRPRGHGGPSLEYDDHPVRPTPASRDLISIYNRAVGRG